MKVLFAISNKFYRKMQSPQGAAVLTLEDIHKFKEKSVFFAVYCTTSILGGLCLCRDSRILFRGEDFS